MTISCRECRSVQANDDKVVADQAVIDQLKDWLNILHVVAGMATTPQEQSEKGHDVLTNKLFLDFLN